MAQEIPAQADSPKVVEIAPEQSQMGLLLRDQVNDQTSEEVNAVVLLSAH